MRKPACFAVIALSSLAMACAAQQGGKTPAPLTTTGQIGPAAEWKPAPDFHTRVEAACDLNKQADYEQCVMTQMSTAGASPEAVHITRILYENLGKVAVVTGFQRVGPVDIARVEYPLEANHNFGLLLVNGSPKVLDVDDLTKLSRAEMEAAPQFQAVKERYPDADLWPGDRSGAVWPQVIKLPDGGIEIVIGYPILKGCQACAHVGLALFGWDFDADGKFVKTKYKPLPPPPKKERPGSMTSPPPP